MSRSQPSTHVRALAALAFASACALAVFALGSGRAEEPRPSAHPGVSVVFDPAPESDASEDPATPGRKIFLDAEGRPSEPDRGSAAWNALEESAIRAPAAPPVIETRPDGMGTLRFPDGHYRYSVAHKQADGSVSTSCEDEEDAR